MENSPDLWRACIKPKQPDQNKYDHGHALIYGGRLMTGAACLAAHAALRIGAGVVTIAAHNDAANIYRSYSPVFLYEPCDVPSSFIFSLRDHRRNAVLIGPGAGREEAGGLRQAVDDLCSMLPERPCVLDADALTVFEDNRFALYDALGPHCVLTPHEGEFRRLFPELAGAKTDRALEAARISGAVIVLKGAETVIAHPDGRVVVNLNAPPTLATAGTGDVLAGLITGLLARRVPPFEAACAAVWIHGEAANLFGTGLIATDLIDCIPAVIKDL